MDPRDVLVDVLRRIDSGEYKPETLAVVWTETAGSGGIKPRWQHRRRGRQHTRVLPLAIPVGRVQAHGDRRCHVKVVNGATKAGDAASAQLRGRGRVPEGRARHVSPDLRADQHNAEPAREDMRFVIGDQWHTEAKARRTRLKKPVLTVNRLPAFVAQYIGSWLQSDTSIELMPSRGGTQAIAEIRQGIIRTILRTRKNKQAPEAGP